MACSPVGRCCTAPPGAPTSLGAGTHRRADPRPVPLGAPAGRRAARRRPRCYPTHGFGSFCSATPASGDSSTIGERTRHQPGADPGRADLRRRPARRAVRLPRLLRPHGRRSTGRARPRSTCRRPNRCDPDELRRRIEAGEWVVDLRDRTAFAAGHLAGTLGFELSDSFVTYLGWLYRWGTPLTLIGETADQIAEARRELVRIGIDDLAGAAVGDIARLRRRERRCGPTASPTSPSWPGPGTEGRSRSSTSARHDEYDDGHVAGALQHPAARAARPPRRGPRGRGVGALRRRATAPPSPPR